jgi:hypothetical protein
MDKKMKRERCEICGSYVPGFNTVYLSSEEELFELFGKLFERIRRALNRKHIYWSETTKNWQITDDDLVRGKIDCDLDSPDYERLPLIVIDGREISWSKFGQMLMTYEGFNFKLEIFDRSDEIP